MVIIVLKLGAGPIKILEHKCYAHFQAFFGLVKKLGKPIKMIEKIA